MMFRSVDIEDQVRAVLADYYAAYCDPLPADYELPFIRVTTAGGSEANTLDTFVVVLEGYAEDDATACEVTRNAVGILRDTSWSMVENTKATRYQDPLRPDLCRYRTTVLITTHKETFNISKK